MKAKLIVIDEWDGPTEMLIDVPPDKLSFSRKMNGRPVSGSKVALQGVINAVLNAKPSSP